MDKEPTAITTVKGYLEATTEMLQKCTARNGYHSLFEFVLKHGRSWKLENERELFFPWPGLPSHCYFNALALAKKHPKRLVYCEGYAASIIPVAHAWCIDLETLAVVDNTWTDHPAGKDYYGIAFKLDYCKRAIKKQRETCFIDAWQEGWPLLSLPEEEWKHEINTR